ncbi:helix-turn-helix domain-containing protein [Limosilactobacillus fermentum]|uniref:helix-turn-helix domain-containing protein n=1 Tax=Limosilactobacillus fermentum TaxID=1613 RepID=UPI000EBBA209|nr:helix-turn-helix transcriptional regulator [Limosilactobacillus fermentum]RGW54284.1 XRE family transcriptional regulator [Limosilactobacillus fermentum]
MIRNRLAELLSERQLKISRVANEIPNLSRNTITSTAQNSGKMIQLETINSLCKYLNITPGEFFEYIPYDIEVAVDDFNLEIRSRDPDPNFESPYESPIVIDKGAINFSLYITVEPAGQPKYTYEFNGATPITLCEEPPFNEPPFNAIPIDLVEPETRYKFVYFWDAKLTPGFKTVVTEQIQRAIRERILSKATFGVFSENLWIAINSNFLTDTSYKKIIDDAKAENEKNKMNYLPPSTPDISSSDELPF